MESFTLYFREGGSDKVYQGSIEPEGSKFVVSIAYGRRGTTLQVGRKTSVAVEYGAARAILEKVFKEKTAKGYTLGESGQPYSVSPRGDRDTGIRCQLLNPIQESNVEQYLDDDHFCMEEKHDGRRMLIQKQGKEVIGINRLGLKIGVPATIQLSALSFAGDFVIDGEAVGNHLHVFDILSRNGADLRDRWYVDRRGDLIKILRTGPQGYIELVETAYETNHKWELFRQCKNAGKEGVVFKQKLGPYVEGRPASGGSQLKFKFCETASFIVEKINAKRSVSLTLLDDGKSVPVGNVTIPANHQVPDAGAVVEVRYLYAFKGDSIFQPVYLGSREDILADECTVSQLKYKAEPPVLAA